MKQGRNDLCRCGSGKKFKHCCEGHAVPITRAPPPAEIDLLLALYNSGRYAELESKARALIGQYPVFGFGWKLLGGALRMQGKDALYAFRRVIQFMPEDAEAHYNLGVAQKSLGKLDNAAASYRRAIELKPDYAEAHSNLGNALKDLGRLDDAVASFRLALKIKPDSVDACNNLGTALKELGQFDEAAACYRHAVAIKPDFALAYYNLGNALTGLGKFDGAAENYRLAVEFKPDFADAYNNLGGAFKELERFDDAAESYRHAIRIKPDFIKAFINLGVVLHLQDKLEDAVECYRRALAIDPKCVEAMIEIGMICMENGAMAEAGDCARKALEIDADNLEARFLLARFSKVKVGDENLAVLAALESSALRTPLLDKHAIPLQFVLGKAFDDIGDYDKAFPHFLTGCKLKRKTFEYDAEQTTQYFDDIMRIFDRAEIDRLRGEGDQSRLPIFILGMPRSGTTLTEQIIASHPEVHGAGELPDLKAITQRDANGTGMSFPYNIPALDQAVLAAWAEDYLAGLYRRAPEAKRVTDKMPANFFAIGLIHAMLPNAKIIHVNRNPVDTCLSCFTQLFNLKQDYTYDLEELGRYYVDYARLMAHWRSVLPAGAFLDVQYEDIVADQETQAKQLIAYCGLDWNDACINFHKNKRPIYTASVTQVRQPIYRSSVERWRNYERFLGPLLDALGDLVPQQVTAESDAITQK